MPIISSLDLNSQYFCCYVITGVMPNGDIIAIKKDKSETIHAQAFDRI